MMPNEAERRASKRFTMSLALKVRSNGPQGVVEQPGQTRDVGFRGLYFTTDAEYELGSEIEFILTLPKEVTQAGDVKIRCRGRVVRTEPGSGHRGVAARIERYEFLPENV
jgi:PilZ domain-containing protein